MYWPGQVFAFPLQTFLAKYKKWYVLVGIDMYSECIGIYPYVFYGGLLVCIGRYW